MRFFRHFWLKKRMDTADKILRVNFSPPGDPAHVLFDAQGKVGGETMLDQFDR
jgi:hypothetical protein